MKQTYEKFKKKNQISINNIKRAKLFLKSCLENDNIRNMFDGKFKFL